MTCVTLLWNILYPALSRDINPMVNRTHVCILDVIPVAVADPRPLERVQRVPPELGARVVQHARVAVAAAGPGVDLH